MKIQKYILTLLIACSVLGTVACTATRTQSSAGEILDDTVITTRVKAAFIDDDTLSANEINVETFKGVVQLSGFVSTAAETRRAETVARGIAGVQSVVNDIVVK